MVFGGLLLVKPSFSREKDGFSKDGCSKQSFSREKDGFEPKNHLFLEKTKKTKKPKKPSFPKLWGWCLQEMVFLVFSRKRWFRTEKKMVFEKNHLFLENGFWNPKKNIFWRPQPHSFGKDVFFFGFFGFLVFWIFLVCWFLLVSCFVVFCLDLARTRLPSAVGPLGGG